MNKKQIFKYKKADSKGKLDEGYAVCVDEKVPIVILETGELINPETGGSILFPTNALQEISELTHKCGTFSFSFYQTRNVPEEVRKELESAADMVGKSLKEHAKIHALARKWESGAAQVRHLTHARGLGAIIRQAEGLMLAEEFAQAVEEHLSGDLKEDFSRGAVATNCACKTGGWVLFASDRNLYFEREVLIGQYIDKFDKCLPPFIDENEDGALSFTGGREVYKKALGEYRKPLRICTEHRLAENFVAGEDSLFYCQRASVLLRKPLTMEYAEEIADIISGKEKERDAYDESEGQER